MELVCSIPYPITQQKLEYKLQSRIRDPYVRFNGRGEIIILPLPYYTQIFIAIEKALKPIKLFLNYEEQIRNLIARKGMIIVDREFTASKLKDISYFALIDGYKNLFYNPMSQKRFLTITQLHDIISKTAEQLHITQPTELSALFLRWTKRNNTVKINQKINRKFLRLH